MLDALHAGVPVLAHEGATWAQRISSAMLRKLGLQVSAHNLYYRAPLGIVFHQNIYHNFFFIYFVLFESSTTTE